MNFKNCIKLLEKLDNENKYLEIDHIKNYEEHIIKNLDNNINNLNEKIYGEFALAFSKYLCKKYEESYYIFINILKYVEKDDFYELKNKCYIYLTLLSISLEKINETCYFYKEALKNLSKHKNENLKLYFFSRICFLLSFNYNKKDEVFKLIEKCDILLKNNNTIEAARVYTILAPLSINMFDDLQRCMNYITKGLDICRYEDIEKIEISLLNSVVSYFHDIGCNKEAIKFLKKIEQLPASNTPFIKASNFINITLCYIEEKDYSSALDSLVNVEYFISSYKSEDKFQILVFKYLLEATIALENNNKDLKYVHEKINGIEFIYNEHKSKLVFAYNIEYQIIYLKGKLAFKRKEFEKAIEYFKMALKTTQRNRELIQLNSSIASCYEESGQYEKALFYYNKEVDWLEKKQKNNLINFCKNIYKEYELNTKKSSIVRLEKITHALKKKVLIDDLTGCFNREYLKEYLNNYNKEKKITCALIDVDYFKLYNDNYGHIKGDEALIKIAFAIKESFFKETSHIIRYGGEEFLLIFEEKNEKNIKNNIDLFFSNLEDLKIEHRFSLVKNKITVSLGCTSKICKKSEDIFILLKNTDNLLYKAKNSGRNRYLLN